MSLTSNVAPSALAVGFRFVVNSGWHGTWLETSVLAAILGDTCKAYSHSFSFAYAQSSRATGNLFLTASKLELLLVATFL